MVQQFEIRRNIQSDKSLELFFVSVVVLHFHMQKNNLYIKNTLIVFIDFCIAFLCSVVLKYL